MAELKIVPMEDRHLDALAELERVCFSSPWTREGLAAELKNPGADFFVAELSSTVAGYAGMNCVLDECYVDNVAVFPQHRRTGVARALLTRLIESARERNASFRLKLASPTPEPSRSTKGLGSARSANAPAFTAIRKRTRSS